MLAQPAYRRVLEAQSTMSLALSIQAISFRVANNWRRSTFTVPEKVKLEDVAQAEKRSLPAIVRGEAGDTDTRSEALLVID